MNPGIPNERKEKSIPIAGVILAGLFTIDVLLINFAEMIQTCGGLVYPFYKVGCIILLLLHFFPGLILDSSPDYYFYYTGNPSQK